MSPKLKFRSEGAAGQALTFMIAGVVFVTSISIVLLETQSAGARIEETGAASVAMGTQEGRDLANLLVSSKGVGWAQGADGLKRLGLAAEHGNGLDPAHVGLLRGAGLDSDPSNGLLDYEEARAALDLEHENGAQFHVRIYPVGLAGIYKSLDLSGSRACYVGDWTSLPATQVAYDPDPLVLVDATQAKLDAPQSGSSATERQLVAGLGLAFRDQTHIEVGEPDATVNVAGSSVPLTDLVPASMLEGDVYPDDKQYLEAVLPSRLPGCDYLFVGTGVDQNALTGAAVKYSIRDWVTAGGALVVMGSDSQNIQWLRPLFDIGVTTVNGGVYASDTNHPVLREPNELDWQSYNNYNMAWDIDDADADKFQHIIMDGSDDVLAISTEGSFGDGRIALTTYRPSAISQTQGFGEALDLLTNLVIYDDRSELYLEYGPPVPPDVQVRVSARVSSLPDPLLGQTPVRVEVFTWGS